MVDLASPMGRLRHAPFAVKKASSFARALQIVAILARAGLIERRHDDHVFFLNGVEPNRSWLHRTVLLELTLSSSDNGHRKAARIPGSILRNSPTTLYVGAAFPS